MRTLRWSLAVVLLLFLVLPVYSAYQQVHRVVWVYDGDTVKLDDGRHVRLIGIDAPEKMDNEKLERNAARSKKDKKLIMAMGQASYRFVRKLLKGKQVRLEYDVEKQDKYHRQLAYLYLLDGTFVNAQIIREGYAYPYPIPPNVRYQQEFKRLALEAEQQGRGLWAQQWRDQ